MNDVTPCPTCGASGKRPCQSTTGRDHKARLRAEEQARRATRQPGPSRPWDGDAVIRIVTAEGRRIAGPGATEHDLERLAAVRPALEDALRVGAQGLIANGANWSGIGEALGVTKSAAFQRYATKKETAA
jgi:hypothetical protein